MAGTLVYSPNWLGDAVMAMPAVQVWRRRNPEARLVILCKPALAEMWRMHACATEVISLSSGSRGTLSMGFRLRHEALDKALILPNSFRSALIPWVARIGCRRGYRRHARGWMLTDPLAPWTPDAGHVHQSWESARVLLGEQGMILPGLPAPRLTLDPGGIARACRALHLPPQAPLVGVIPGAARGESKRWPHFAEAAVRLADEVEQLRFVVMGTPAEADLCERVASRLGARAVCAAGRTSLQQFASLLASCRVVLCNDSGGMHLAAAVGTPVVAVFGLTDPVRTGPLGAGHAIIRPRGVRGDRAISRDSPEAVALLGAIPPEEVVHAALRIVRARTLSVGEPGSAG